MISILCSSQLPLAVGDSATAAAVPLSTLTKLLRTAKLPQSPHFFNITSSGHQYKFAVGGEEERSRWVRAVKKQTVIDYYNNVIATNIIAQDILIIITRVLQYNFHVLLLAAHFIVTLIIIVCLSSSK